MQLIGKKLEKTYGGRKVVKGVDIEVNRGEIVGLLGPNGAGKTTTFYMIVGMVRPNGGSILLDEKDISTLPMYKRAKLGIGYLPQEASVFRQLSVEDNIKSILEFRGMKKKEIQERADTLIEEFHLEKVRKSLGIQLSGGERRRCEIARCLASDPNFILLDEPFAGVDPIAVEDIQQNILNLKKKNIGILITDHNVQETLSITERTYLLIDGSVFISGKAETLANNESVKKMYLGSSFELKKKTFS